MTIGNLLEIIANINILWLLACWAILGTISLIKTIRNKELKNILELQHVSIGLYPLIYGPFFYSYMNDIYELKLTKEVHAKMEKFDFHDKIPIEEILTEDQLSLLKNK